jgi:carbon storage regulator CsrA
MASITDPISAFRKEIMLVLTRKRSEMIQIGDDVIIKVIETGPRWVKIGIEAPDNVRVIRAELFGRPGPRHPLAVFLEKRRLEKLRDAKSNVDDPKIEDRRSRIDTVSAQSPAAPHLSHD